MKLAGINFPEPLLAALRNDGLVIFAGSGVSMGAPAYLPDFGTLADQIAKGTSESRPKLETEDRFLGRLHQNGVNIYDRAADELKKNGVAFTELHRNLLRLFPSSEQVRIVTTNFDLLFEHAAKDVFNEVPEVFRAPALPLGKHFCGIVHLHGAVSHPHEMVLTDADFGRAYLIEGWACRFLLDLFLHYTVLFVGYSHNDTIVSYLARALPESEKGMRFALVQEANDSQHWNALGIEPITYPKTTANDHSGLYNGVQRLAELYGWNIINWEHEITQIASMPPPIDDEKIGIIEDTLRDQVKLRFFAKAASLPEWINWLDNRKHLDVLFADKLSKEQEPILASLALWLSSKFAISHAENVMLLISKHGMYLNPILWEELINEIACAKEIDKNTLQRWVSLLLVTAPKSPNSWELMDLGEKCIQLGATFSLLAIFEAMIEEKCSIQRSIPWPIESEHSRIDVILKLVGDSHDLNELWERGLKPALPQICEFLLKLVIGHLEDHYYTLNAWQKANLKWDEFGIRRPTIEPHEQNKYPESIDVLIDISRDCLEWLNLNREQISKGWRDYLAGSDMPLLRRLAVHAIAESSYLLADDKIEWLLTNIELHDISLRHETFRLLRMIYSSISSNNRKRLIEKITTYKWSEDHPNHEMLTARSHFEWLHWLNDSDPACNLARQALSKVVEVHPEFKSSLHPDITSWISVGWTSPHSPWTTDELLAKPASEWISDLLSFVQNEMEDPNLVGLMRAISEAVKSDFNWGIGLAEALAKIGKWDSYLWSSLMQGWSEAELKEWQSKKVLTWLDKAELYLVHAHEIAQFLLSLVKNDDKSLNITLLNHANKIGKILWQSLDREDSGEKCDDWLMKAINHPAGVLAEFWLGSLSLWRMLQAPVPSTLNDDYREFFNLIIQDDTIVGRLGRSVLASQFDFLLTADESWARENLLPLFDFDNNALEFQAAWHGYLTWGQLSPTAADALENYFLKSVQRVEHELTHMSNRFIEFYVFMLGFFISGSPERWIREFFKYISTDKRHIFAEEIGKHLRHLNDAQQLNWWDRWLKDYLKDRIQGVPKPLVPAEIEKMLNWLPNMQTIFGEAVELVIQMQNYPLQYSRLIYDIRKKDLLQSNPEEVGKLLLFIGNSGSPSRIFRGIREIVNTLVQRGISPKTENSLKELLVKLGY
ncbi:MAG TPA: hypothetical protein DC024_10240 [Clostridiales bacterium]|jgi:hypothetical protein|nr:hypothetical protein [Clostridiales bacterium]